MAQTATSFFGRVDGRSSAGTDGETRTSLALESVRGTAIGSLGTIPILTGRPFVHDGRRDGRQHQPPLNQPTAKATYTLPYHWFHIATDASASPSQGRRRCRSSTLDLELTGGLENLRHQVTRQFVTNGDAILAHLINSGGSSATHKLTPSASEGAAYGFSALQRGWLQARFPVSIGYDR